MIGLSNSIGITRKPAVASALATNLVSGYLFEDAAASATYADVLTAKPLTANGSLTSVTGKINQAVAGFGSGVYLSRDPALVTALPWAISLWFYVTTTASTTQYLVCQYDGGVKEALRISGGRTVIIQYVTNGTTRISYTHSITVNTWHHLAVSSDDTTAKLYYDGVYRGTGAAGTIAGLTTQVGADGAGSNHLDGRVDSLYFWSRVLTDGNVSINETAGGEIAELYNIGNGVDYPF